MINIKAFFLIAATVVCFLESCANPKPDSTWKRAVAEVIMTPGGKGSSTEIVFYDEDDNRYYAYAVYLSLYGLQIGDKFAMLFNPKDPKQLVVYDYRPVFVESDSNNIAYTKGEITRLFRSGFSFSKKKESTYSVEFSYTVNGKKYRREQVLPKGFRDKYPGICEGSQYKVGFKKENPRVAIIFLGRRM